MNTPTFEKVERKAGVSPHDKKMLMWSVALVWVLVVAVLMTAAVDEGPACFEDEVIVWTGDAHDKCVTLDKFAPAMTDTVVVDLEHCDDTQGGYLRCEVDPAAMIGER